MSDIGVFAGQYVQLREVADLLDSVLLVAHASPEAVTTNDLEKLAHMLETAADVKGRFGANGADDDGAARRLSELVVALRSESLSSQAIASLENLATTIDTSLSVTASKLRGV